MGRSVGEIDVPISVSVHSIDPAEVDLGSGGVFAEIAGTGDGLDEVTRGLRWEQQGTEEDEKKDSTDEHEILSR
jgi:hypothetical protein